MCTMCIEINIFFHQALVFILTDTKHITYVMEKWNGH